MKRWNLFYLLPAAALLVGLAHLRSDWLGGAPKHSRPSADRAVTSAVWALPRNESHTLSLFLRQR
jgi:hypothetical protein